MTCLSTQVTNAGFMCLLLGLLAGPIALVARAVRSKAGPSLALTWVVRMSTLAMMGGVFAGMAVVILTRRC